MIPVASARGRRARSTRRCPRAGGPRRCVGRRRPRSCASPGARDRADTAPAELPACFPAALADRLHRERVGQEGAAGGRVAGVRVDAVEPLQRVLAGHVGRLSLSASSDVSTTRSRCASPSWSEKSSSRSERAVSIPSPASRRSQKSSAASSPTRHTIVCTLPARTAVGSPAVLEEADVVAVGGLLVPMEDVVGVLGLVDRLLHDPQAQHPHVEVGVAGGVGGDSGDVVDALEFTVRSSGRR